MAKIHELSTVLTDQIAAGEVIERPASVVKELVENAIDANSTVIDVNVLDAGLKQIQVVDNGDGIDRDDVPLAFERHATSKITNREDLFRVASLGFRGEALPSIAAVADVTMATSTGGEGTFMHIDGGKEKANKPAEARRGTEVVVRNLFGHVPARLKYMKSLNTELANITDIMNRLALSYPAIAFTLTHNGKELMKTAGRNDLLQVIAGIYGVSNARKMVPVDAERDGYHLAGFISLPELTRASRNYVSFLLNGRYVHNTALNRALIKGYGSKLMVGRYPLAVLDITMDPLLIDVNVHPAKQEVRLSDEDTISKLVTETIAATLAKENLIPDALQELGKPKQQALNADQLAFDLNDVSTHHTVKPARVAPVEQVTPTVKPVEAPMPFQTKAEKLADALPDQDLVPVVVHHKRELKQNAVADFAAKYRNETIGLPFGEERQTEAVTEPASAKVMPFEAHETAEERFPRLKFIGQMHGTYLLAEAEDGMYLLDQHAAQERVNYEFYRQAIGEVSDDQQNLLVPIVLNYPTSDMLRISEREDALASVGIHFEPFGQNSILIREHPMWFKAGQEEDTLKEMIDWVLADGKISVAAFREKTAIMMSCKRAIKANHHLDDQQAIALIDKLGEAENPFNCPHGRPVLVHFSNQDMERMFKRIQDPHQSSATEG